MKGHRKLWIGICLALAILLGGDFAFRTIMARPVPILKDTDIVLAVTVSDSPLHHTESDITIPEEYDENSILTRLSQSEMVWVEHLSKGESTQIGEAELWISVLLENEGFMNIHLGEKNLVLTKNALYEIADGDTLLADIKAILTQEDTVLLGEGYSTYPVILDGENIP